jgi:hypothetical protein
MQQSNNSQPLSIGTILILLLRSMEMIAINASKLEIRLRIPATLQHRP